MVDDAEDGVEVAFNCVVSITERSVNLRKDLRKEFLEAMRSLRHYFVQVQINLDSKRETIKALELEVKACKREIHILRI